MIRLEGAKGDYRLYSVQEENLPSSTCIICSDVSRGILFHPYLAGKELQEKMERMSRIFVDVMTEKALKGVKLERLVEFVLLSGGLYYSLARGFREAHGYALPQCFLGIKRQRVEGTEGHFRAVSTYENFEALPDDATVIIGDTVATGSTLVRAIGDLERAAEERDSQIKRIIVCSLACSTEGARKLGMLEKKMAERGQELHLIVAEQLFHLMPDGTDLRFLREDSLMPEETRRYTLERYGEYLGKEMKCAVFDWGTRCKNPKAHYEEFLAFCGGMLNRGDIDEKALAELSRMRAGALEGLRSFGKTI